MATIKQIAEKAGVSLSTVSIVLRGNARERHISEATEQLVRQTAAELGYQPNLAARRLRDGERSPTFIALYLSDDFRTPMMLRLCRVSPTRMVMLVLPSQSKSYHAMGVSHDVSG